MFSKDQKFLKSKNESLFFWAAYMANTKSKIKQGMGGSSSGKSRSEKTEDLKAETRSYEGSWIKKY